MNSSIFGVLAVSLSLAAGCGVAPESASAVESDSVAALSAALISTVGITGQATYREVVTGVPTYGSPATTPVLTVHVEVDDAAVRAQAPGFDGLEQVFVRVPKTTAGRLSWDSFDLHYSGETRRGYYGEIKIDVHDSDSLWNADWEALKTQGVALGLRTNVGIIWAQDPDHNLAVDRK